MTIHHRFRLLLGAGVLAIACMAGVPRSFAVDARSDLSFADVASRVRNSVVTVAAAVVDNRQAGRFSRGRESRAEGGQSQSFEDFTPLRPKRGPGEPVRQFTSIGSGFIIDQSGLVVTNNHVIEGGNTIYVILADGSELKVDKIIGRDPKTDITLLKVTPKASKPLNAVPFGDSAKMRVGDWVIAIGNPFGLNGTITAGIISGRGRDINAGPYDDFLQTDASINRGNSGGPLFNALGEVIGINTAIFSPSGGSIGLGFAIPSNTAQRILDQLKRYGETRWGWIGVRLQTPSDDLASGFHLASAEGALIARVDKGSPADQAGLQEGDLVLSFAGSDVKHARQLPRIVAQANVGEEADMVILRGGQRKSLRVKVGLLEEFHGPAIPPPHGKSKRHKISFQSLSEENREQFSLAGDAEGAIVTDTQAQEVTNGQVRPGDLIVEAAHHRVRSLEDLEERLAELRSLSRPEALLTIQDRDGGVRFASLPLGDD
ncbi:MAG: Do family serine endopeptidase [Rhodomicrobium sp.]